MRVDHKVGLLPKTEPTLLNVKKKHLILRVPPKGTGLVELQIAKKNQLTLACISNAVELMDAVKTYVTNILQKEPYSK